LEEGSRTVKLLKSKKAKLAAAAAEESQNIDQEIAHLESMFKLLCLLSSIVIGITILVDS